MSHRTQITLEDAQYERLLSESRRTGLGLAALVRQAVDAQYGMSSIEEKRRALDFSFGSLTAVEVDGPAHVEQMRPGLGRRITP